MSSLALSPRLAEGIVRLGTHLPFGAAVDTFAFFTGVRVTDESARTLTERAGAALVRLEDAEAERCEAIDKPLAPIGPEEQVVSVDGAMVPLIGGEWAEVKTLVVGRLERIQRPDGSWDVHTSDMSYCSRLLDAERFGAAAEGEFYRRGTDRARLVCAPTDGAEWISRFLGFHCPQAVRILDFPHAVEHLAAAAQVTFGPGTLAATNWLETQRRELREGAAAKVFAALQELPVDGAVDPAAAKKTRDEVLAYLTKREQQIAYAEFARAGFPIGSGIVESANKLVVEERLKGSGMHWERSNVNSMLALRAASCSGRWNGRWPQIWNLMLSDQRAQRLDRRRICNSSPMQTLLPSPPLSTKPTRPVSPKPLPTKGTVVNGRPTKDHPWKRRSLLHPRQSSVVNA